MEHKRRPRNLETKAQEHAHQTKRTAPTGTPPASLLDVIDAVPFYVMLVDDSHNILIANAAVRRHLGAEPLDIVGKYCPKVIHGMDGPFPGCPLEEAAETGKAVEHEVLDEKTGRWVRSAIYPMGGVTPDGHRVFFHIVTDITDRKQAEERLVLSEQQLRSLSLHLESVREEEKTRLARDLHDETSQVVSGLIAYLEAARYKLPPDARESRTLLEKSQQLAGSIIDDLRKAIYELHPSPLRDLGLVSAVASLVRASLEPAGVEVSLKTKGKVRRLSPELETVLFRVIQEAVSNVIHHSKATSADITIHFRNDRIEARVADNGVGFDVAETLSLTRRLRAFGLLSIKERIEGVGGTIRITSNPGEGAEIHFEVPADRDRSDAASREGR